MHLTGATGSTEASFPVSGAGDRTYNGGPNDAFVAKLNPMGTALEHASYIGGSDGGNAMVPPGVDSGTGIALDPAGSVFVVAGRHRPTPPSRSWVGPT